MPGPASSTRRATHPSRRDTATSSAVPCGVYRSTLPTTASSAAASSARGSGTGAGDSAPSTVQDRSWSPATADQKTIRSRTTSPTSHRSLPVPPDSPAGPPAVRGDRWPEPGGVAGRGAAGGGSAGRRAAAVPVAAASAAASRVVRISSSISRSSVVIACRMRSGRCRSPVGSRRGSGSARPAVRRRASRRPAAARSTAYAAGATDRRPAPVRRCGGDQPVGHPVERHARLGHLARAAPGGPGPPDCRHRTRLPPGQRAHRADHPGGQPVAEQDRGEDQRACDPGQRVPGGVTPRDRSRPGCRPRPPPSSLPSRPVRGSSAHRARSTSTAAGGRRPGTDVRRTRRARPRRCRPGRARRPGRSPAARGSMARSTAAGSVVTASTATTTAVAAPRRPAPAPGPVAEPEAQRDQERQRHHGRGRDGDPGEARLSPGPTNRKPTPRTVCRKRGSAAVSPSFLRSQ